MYTELEGAEILKWASQALSIPLTDIEGLVIIQQTPWSSVFCLTTRQCKYAIKIGGPVQLNEISLYQVLSKIAPSAAPRFIASDNRLGQYWLCIEWVEGQIFGDAPNLTAAVSTAELLANTQMLFTKHLDKIQFLPDRSTDLLVESFGKLLDYIAKFWKRAQLDYCRFMPAKSVPLLPNFLGELEDFRPKLEFLVDELMEWPVSLEHGDMHARNFGLSFAGKPFILDWTNACISSPFISLEFLIRVVRNTLGSNDTIKVCKSYLQQLQIGNMTERLNALQLFRGLAPLNFALALLFRETVEGLTPGELSWLIVRSLNQMLLYYENRNEWDILSGLSH